MQGALTSLFFSKLPLVIFSCLIPLTAVAQITSDGTTSTTVNHNGNDFTIDQGDRVGDNLFHSFDEFSVPTLGSALFDNASDIANIFSRVTGSNISNIDGLLRANGAANLFLINPNGIIFGENARLNLGGSFFASTADSLLFEGNTEFSASKPQASPLLEVNIPIGLNFRDNPGEITNRSTDVGLEVIAGETLALIGGNIDFEGGQITAPGANVWLGGLSVFGTVNITDNFDLSLPDGIARADISFSDGAGVSTANDHGGGIAVIGNSINFSETSQLFGGITANSGFDGAQAGDINVNATGAVNLSGDSIIQNRVNEGAIGNSGDINVTAQLLTLIEGSFFSTSTFGEGNAGTITVNATDSVSFDVGAAFSRVGSTGVGTAGSISLSTDNFLIDGGIITSSNLGQGDAGNISIAVSDKFTAANSVILNNIGDRFGAPTVGRVGNIEITAREISLENTAQIQAGAFSGATVEGTGTVSLTATESISFTGTNTGIFSNNDPGSFGNASNTQLFAPTITLNDGAGITASNAANGQGGSVTIETEQLNLNNGSLILADAAGKINIEANSLSLSNQARIEAATQSEIGEAAIINLTIDEDIIIENNSLISATALGNANGGNVTINANDGSIVAFPNQNNDIIANADRGRGGNINIITQEIFGLEERRSTPTNQTNDIDASSQFGLQGNFSLNTPEVDPSSGLIELPEAVGDASDQISQNPCEQGVGSEFIITGQGGIPPNPNETLNSNKVRVGLVEPVPSRKEEEVTERQEEKSRDISPENSTSEAVPAQGWIFNDKGEVMLTSYKTTNTEMRRSRQKHPLTCSSGI